MTAGPVDSFDVIRALFSKHPDPSQAQAREIASSIFDVYVRLMRVRQVAPTVVLSEKIYRLMDLLGLKGHRRPKGGEPEVALTVQCKGCGILLPLEKSASISAEGVTWYICDKHELTWKDGKMAVRDLRKSELK